MVIPKIGYYIYAIILEKIWTLQVIGKVRRLGAENGQFQPNKASNGELRMKSLQNKITGTGTNFSTNFGGKLSFMLLPYIFSAPSCTTTIVTLEPCTLNAET